MSETKPRVRVAAPTVRTVDSFQNFAARLGIGTDNQFTGSSYGFNPITRNRVLLEFMYRGAWLVGQAVDCVAEDMTRAGVDLKSDASPNDLDAVQERLIDLGAWGQLADTVKWARLYGGALAVLLIDGQDPRTPLRLDTVGKGQFRGLLVLDRWMVQPTLDTRVTDLCADLGRPKFYDVTADAPAYRGQRIHHSRVVRVDGIDLPHWQRITENDWGLSVLERLYDRMVAFDSATTGAAQLVYKAHLRTVRVKGLRDILGAGGKAEEALVKMFDMVRVMQSNEGLTLLDGEDEFQTHQYTFSGLSDVMLQFAQQISGALQIPLVRLFGQSPAGLNSTGESDVRSYYDSIAQQQNSRLRTGVARILDLTWRSIHGSPPPANYGFVFNPLWQMSDTEKATIAVGITNAATQAYEAGVVDKATAMRELRQSADVTGVWSNIDDAAITEAANEPPEPGEAETDVPMLAALAKADDGADKDDGPTSETGSLGVDKGAEG